MCVCVLGGGGVKQLSNLDLGEGHEFSSLGKGIYIIFI